MRRILLVGLWFCMHAVCTEAKPNRDNLKYSNMWVAKIEGGEEVAKRVARDLGYTYKGQCGELKDYYEMVRDDHPRMSERHNDHLTRGLMDLDEVKWAKQQMYIKLETAGLWKYTEEAKQEKLMKFLRTEYAKSFNSIGSDSKTFFSGITFPLDLRIYLSSLNQGDISKLGSFSTKPFPKSKLNYYKGTSTNIGLLSKKISAYVLQYNDPSWRLQWYMQDYRTTDIPVMYLNIVPVHRMGYTGRSVVVAILDQGVEPQHPDLKQNYIEKLSYDYCDDVPMPYLIVMAFGRTSMEQIVLE